jgi:hypothetical protein
MNGAAVKQEWGLVELVMLFSAWVILVLKKTEILVQAVLALNGQ